MVQVPKYSNQGGEVSLPTRRLTPMSGSAIQQLAAPGRALAGVGRAMIQEGDRAAKYEIKKAEQDAKMWVISAETELETDMAAKTQDIQFQQTARDYLHDDSFKDGSNPDTYTNQVMSGFENTLTKKDDKGNERYKAPNAYAADLWNERLTQLRSGYKIGAMRYEGDLRSAAQLEELKGSLTETASQAYNNPGAIDTYLNRADTLTTGVDDPTTKDIEGYGGLVKGKDLIGVSDAAKRDITYNALDGMIAQSPFEAYATLNTNLKTSRQGGFGSDKLRSAMKQYLSESEIETLLKKAKAASMVVHQQDVLALETDVGQHLQGVSNGKTGLSEFQDEKSAKAQFMVVYGGSGPFAKAKVELIPELKELYEVAWAKYQSAHKVAKMTGSIVNDASNMPITEFTEFMRDVEKLSMLNAVDLTGKDLSSYGINFAEGMTNVEIASSISAALPKFSEIIKMRTEDFGEFANRQPGINGMDNGPEKFDKINALAGQLGHKNVNLLPNAEAESIVSQLKAMKQPEMAAAMMEKLGQEYGPYFPQLWNQLTDPDNPNRLNINWMIAGSFHGTNLGTSYTAAMMADKGALEQTLSTQMEGYNVSSANKGVATHLNGVLKNFTGGMPHRYNMGSEMHNTFLKMTMMIMSQNPGGITGDQAAATVKKMFETSGVQFAEGENHNWYVLPSHKDSNGTQINAKLVETKLDNLIGSEENTSMLIANMDIIVPGSMSSVIDGDATLRSKRLASFIAEKGSWAMSDDGEGVYLVVPILAGSEASADGQGLMMPLKRMNHHAKQEEFLYFSFEYLQSLTQ